MLRAFLVLATRRIFFYLGVDCTDLQEQFVHIDDELKGCSVIRLHCMEQWSACHADMLVQGPRNEIQLQATDTTPKAAKLVQYFTKSLYILLVSGSSADRFFGRWTRAIFLCLIHI